MTEKTITARLDALRRKADLEDERDYLLAAGFDLDETDLHVRALLAMRERGITDYTPDQYVEAYERERLSDEPDTPAKPRPDHDAIHAEAVKLLASRGVDKPDFAQYSDALTEVAGG
jgi:hypothetical protein